MIKYIISVSLDSEIEAENEEEALTKAREAINNNAFSLEIVDREEVK